MLIKSFCVLGSVTHFDCFETPTHIKTHKSLNPSFIIYTFATDSLSCLPYSIYIMQLENKCCQSPGNSQSCTCSTTKAVLLFTVSWNPYEWIFIYIYELCSFVTDNCLQLDRMTIGGKVEGVIRWYLL